MTTTASASRIVLVVDDDDDIRTAVQEVLQEEGYTTQGAANGKQALDLLRTSDPPALMLLDLMMPEMDGWELLVRMAEDAALCQIPVALMSAHPSIRQAFDHDRKKVVGASMLLPKPLNLLRLLSVVGRIVPNAEGLRPS